MEKFTTFVKTVRYGYSSLDGDSIKRDIVNNYCLMRIHDNLADIQNLVYTLAKMSTSDLDLILDIDVDDDFHLEDYFCELIVALSVDDSKLNHSQLEYLSNHFLAYLFNDFSLEEIESILDL